MPKRFDSAQISTIERTPFGGIRVPAVPTRAGVFAYQEVDARGVARTVYEYRPPEEVARADSLASLEDVPLTIGHPRAGVTAANASVGVGHVRAGSIKADASGLVHAQFVVTHADAVRDVETRVRTELSSGYSVDLDPTSGVTPAGERYDRVQRNIVYNHVALLKPGEGRMGGTCSLRLDAAGEQLLEDAPADPVPPAQEKPIMKIKIKVDGKDKEVEKGSDEHLAYLEARADSAEARARTAEAAQAAHDARVAAAARTELEARAKALGVETVRKDAAGTEAPLSNREIMVSAIKRFDSTFSDVGKSDDYVTARFDTLKPSTPKPRTDATDATRALDTAPDARTDGADAFDPEAHVKAILDKSPTACRK